MENNTKSNDKLKKALKNIQSKLGEDSLNFFTTDKKFQSTSTGIYGLNRILGTNGIVEGKIYEVFGPESGGKTSLCLQIIENFQKENKVCAFVDVENTLDPYYTKKIGIDNGKLILSQPSSGEKAFEVIEALIKTDSIDLIIIDSVAALLPQNEIDGSISDNTIGLQARLMSKGLRKIGGLLAKSKTSIIFINQLRSNINTFFGSSETTPGGRALKFYSSVRIEVRRVESIYKANKCIGNRIRIKIAKNKLNAPFLNKVFDFYFGSGIDIEKDLIDEAIITKKIEQKGPYYYYDKKLIAQGKEELYQKIISNKKILSSLSS